MLGVALTTAALIIVLSVFNGLGDLLKTLNSSFDPEIKIVASEGKSFEVTEEMKEKISTVPGVKFITEVIEDYAYARYRKADQVITIKGVSDNFILQKRIPEANIREGELKLRDNNVNYAIIGMGVQSTLSIAVNDPLFPLEIYYIKNVRPSSAITNPSQYYSRQNITPGAVFSIVQSFDESYVIVPLEFAVDLLNYGSKRTSLEIKTTDASSAFAVEEEIQSVLGDKFIVLNSEEQHQDLYKLLKMEKLFSFIAFSLLLIIGSINIFFCLMMLALDKKRDISILSSMGATQQMIANVFLAEGVLIASLGATFGLCLGGVLCWLQMRYGFISMGMESAVTPGYPVKVQLADFVATFAVLSVITFLISLKPARLASRLVTHNEMLGKQI